MPTPEQLVDMLAEQGADVDDRTDNVRGSYGPLVGEILETPGRLDMDSATRAVASLASRVEMETGDADEAERYADRLLERIEMGWIGLHDLPNTARGSYWNDAEGVLLAVAARQAMVETGHALATMEGAVDAELTTTPVAQLLGVQGLKEASKIRPSKASRIKDKRKQRAEARAAKAVEDNG